MMPGLNGEEGVVPHEEPVGARMRGDPRRVRGLPEGPGADEEAAQQETDAVNHNFWHRNHGFLTLYSFSLENWKRPVQEVSFLMQMYIDYLRQENRVLRQQLAGRRLRFTDEQRRCEQARLRRTRCTPARR